MRAFTSLQSQPKMVYEALQIPLVMTMVAAGQGVSLLPSFLSQIPMTGVIFRPLVLTKGEPPWMTYNLIGPAVSQNAAAKSLVALARELIPRKFL